MTTGRQAYEARVKEIEANHAEIASLSEKANIMYEDYEFLARGEDLSVTNLTTGKEIRLSYNEAIKLFGSISKEKITEKFKKPSVKKSKNNKIKDPDKTIYCLFGVANEYYQPQNDLRRFWFKKPSLQDILDYFELKLETISEEDLIDMVDLFKGKIIDWDDTNYRIEQVEEKTSVYGD